MLYSQSQNKADDCCKFISDNNTNTGDLRISTCTAIERPSFLQYIEAGCELDFMVGIEFSTILPGQINLHTVNNGINLYETAINASGRVLEYYDTDKLYNVYGFGGSNLSGKHCFPLGGNEEKVCGKSGIINLYRKYKSTIQVNGKNNFSEIIIKAQEIAKIYQSTPGKYLILLLLTDGKIDDINETKDAIIEISFNLFIVN